MLGNVLIRLGFIKEDALASLLATRTGFENIDLKNEIIDLHLVKTLPHHVALRCRVVPLALKNMTLKLAMADPYDVVAMDEVRRYFPRGIDIVPFVAPETEITGFIASAHPQTHALDTAINNLRANLPAQAGEQGAQHPVIRLVNNILSDAVYQRASDIHIEPEEHFVRLRYRIDGILHQMHDVHRDHWPEISHRFKIMAGMNIADTRSVQDGRFSYDIGTAQVDFRMAVMPVMHGENIVIRVLDPRLSNRSLKDLGMSAEVIARLENILRRPEGMILATGPTGSGKTTTLYAMMQHISDVSMNIMTLEDPIEYHFPLIRQTSVKEKQGLGFADGVRGILRQDPDAILIGEMRDHDTAHMALRAAMTGHKVFATLHCNDTLAAPARLADLGLTPQKIEGNIAGVIAQRLVRRLCRHCAHCDRPAAPIGFAEQQALISPTAIAMPHAWQAVGCSECRGTGYHGRVAVVEIMPFDDGLEALFSASKQRSEIQAYLRDMGFISMAQDALNKVAQGLTTVEEVQRNVPGISAMMVQ